MSKVRGANLGLLLRCYEGLRNWRALVMLVVGFVLATLIMVLNATIAAQLAYRSPGLTMALGGLLILVALLVLLAGINGAGLLLVDQADDHPPRSFSAAFFGGLGVTLQSIVCLIILGVGLLLVVLTLWALSFLGKIPGIGPLFAFLLAGPTMLVLALCYAVLVFGVTLMFVALWRGKGMIGSVGRAIDIVIQRPLDTMLHFIVLALLIVPIQIFVAVVLAGGGVLTGAMYASSSFGGSPLATLARAGASMGAAGVSIGMMLAAVWALFVLIGILGNILIFDSLAAETSETSAGFLGSKVKQIKQKVDEHRPVAAKARCAQCGVVLTPGDKFCGECGTAQG